MRVRVRVRLRVPVPVSSYRCAPLRPSSNKSSRRPVTTWSGVTGKRRSRWREGRPNKDLKINEWPGLAGSGTVGKAVNRGYLLCTRDLSMPHIAAVGDVFQSQRKKIQRFSSFYYVFVSSAWLMDPEDQRRRGKGGGGSHVSRQIFSYDNAGISMIEKGSPRFWK